MTNKNQCEDTDKRIQAAGEWIALASEHADIAVDLAEKPRFRTHALYDAQQSMETATKGMAIAAGVSHDEVRRHSHDYPYLFFLLLHKTISESDGVRYANELLSPYYAGQGQYDVTSHLEKMLTLTSSQKNKGMIKAQKESAEHFFDALLQLPPEGIEVMLNQLSELNEKMRQTLNKDGMVASRTVQG